MSLSRSSSKPEDQFLGLAYNRFYDLYDEVMSDSFWKKDAWERFSKIHQAYSIYGELLSYEPIKWTIEHLRVARPPKEAEIGSEMFKVIRNVLVHFPIYNSWDDVWVTEQLVNWCTEGRTIDKFFKQYDGADPVKYRFWESDKKGMTYLSIMFPKGYSKGDKVWLKDLISERDGVRFSFVLMRQILDTQVEK